MPDETFEEVEEFEEFEEVDEPAPAPGPPRGGKKFAGRKKGDFEDDDIMLD